MKLSKSSSSHPLVIAALIQKAGRYVRQALWPGYGHRQPVSDKLKLNMLVFALVAWVGTVPTSTNSAEVLEGVWLLEPNSAVQIFDCSGLLCGRVVWLRNVRDPTGQIQRDKQNPEPVLRTRLVCGLTVIWGLRSAGSGKWQDGWFYNPDDGETYSVTAEIRSSDMIETRIYKVLPLFGTTKTLRRVPRLNSKGWC